MLLQNWWMTTLLGDAPAHQPPLEGNHDTDVLVIGGGVAGLAAAQRLHEGGREVTLLEREICGGGTSGRSSGFLTPDSELDLHRLVGRFGPEGGRHVWDVPARGIRMMADRVRAHRIECDLVLLDSLFLARRGHADAARQEHETRTRLGMPSKLLEGDALRAAVGSRAYESGVRYGDTYGINALRYAQGVKGALVERGVRIHESTEVLELDGATARTHLGRVRANDVIVCADKPWTLTQTGERAFPVQTFLSVSEPLSERDLASLFPEGPLMCWDSRLVYTYFRPTGDGRLLVGGGTLPTTYASTEVHAQHPIHVVHRRFKRDFPQIAHLRFVQYWPGRIDTTRDLLPTIAMGDAGWPVHHVLGAPGLPWATFCGDLVARRILKEDLGGDERYFETFSPARGFPVPLKLRRVLGRPPTFALSHAWAKYGPSEA